MTCTDELPAAAAVGEEWPAWARRITELRRLATMAAEDWKDDAHAAIVDITVALYATDDRVAVASIVDAMNRLKAALEALTDGE